MTTLTVSLPDALGGWVRARIEDGGYASGDDYLRDLIRRDRENAAERAALEAALDAGRASGVSARGVKDIIAAERARVA